MNQILKLSNYIIELKLLEGLKLAKKYKHQDLVSVIVDVIYSLDADNERDTQKTINNFRAAFKVDNQFKVSDFLELIKGIDYETLAKDIFKSHLMTKTKGGVLRSQAVVEWAKIMQKAKVETIDDLINLYANQDIGNRLQMVSGQESGISYRRLLQIAGDDMFIKVERYHIDFINDAINQIVDGTEAIKLLKGAVIGLSDRFVGLELKDLDYVIWNHMTKPLPKRFPQEIRNLKRPPKKNKIVKLL